MCRVERRVVLNGLFDLVFVTLARRPTTMFLSFAVNDSVFFLHLFWSPVRVWSAHSFSFELVVCCYC